MVPVEPSVVIAGKRSVLLNELERSINLSIVFGVVGSVVAEGGVLLVVWDVLFSVFDVCCHFQVWLFFHLMFLFFG